jgi:hypothetical protein
MDRSDPSKLKWQSKRPAAIFGTQYSSGRCPHTFWTMEATVFKGALLWLIGIPLPIILILFFMGWLS